MLSPLLVRRAFNKDNHDSVIRKSDMKFNAHNTNAPSLMACAFADLNFA
jgi:hypothetical protein